MVGQEFLQKLTEKKIQFSLLEFRLWQPEFFFSFKWLKMTKKLIFWSAARKRVFSGHKMGSLSQKGNVDAKIDSARAKIDYGGTKWILHDKLSPMWCKLSFKGKKGPLEDQFWHQVFAFDPRCIFCS